MRQDYAVARVLIWGKTYPELSSRHTETVCTGGLREDGRPIRLYPVPLRYLEGAQQYALYDVVEVAVTKSTRDPRPESYKIDKESLRKVGHVSTDNSLWAGRREWLQRNESWHFRSVADLKEAQRERGTSMGLVTPGEILDVRLRRKPEKARREHTTKWEEVTGQVDMFPQEYKKLEFIPYDVRLKWRCAEACSECRNTPHDMLILDWGLLELGRREGWETARARMESIADLTTHEFRVFMGNFRLRMHVFGVIGLWYPKKRPQQDLFSRPMGES